MTPLLCILNIRFMVHGKIFVKNIIARDVSWASSVFRDTPAAASLGGYGGGVGNPTNRRGSGVQ